MFCTKDLKITRILEQGMYSGIVEAVLQLPKSVCEQIFSSDEIGLSTRSCFARNFSEFYGKQKDIRVHDNSISLILNFRNLAFPIFYEEGDEIARIYCCNKSEIITGKNLENLVNTINGRLVDNETAAIEFTDFVFTHMDPYRAVKAKELVADRDKYLRRTYLPEWDTLNYNVLLTSKKVLLPEDTFGKIVGTTWRKDTYQLNSRIIDPGWKGSVIFEVRAKDIESHNKPLGLVQFYKATKPQSS